MVSDPIQVFLFVFLFGWKTLVVTSMYTCKPRSKYCMRWLQPEQSLAYTGVEHVEHAGNFKCGFKIVVHVDCM